MNEYKMSKMEFRVGSAPVRSSALSQGNVIVDSTSEPPLVSHHQHCTYMYTLTCSNVSYMYCI